MKKILVFIVVCLMIVTAMFIPRKYKAVVIEEKKDGIIRVMSYNVKNSYQDNEGWYERRLALIDQIRDVNPDTLGIQEADESWMAYLKETLTEYEIIGEGRDGGEAGEHTAILYLKDKYTLLDSGTFWLSEIPELPSQGWDGACPRVCTYVKLEDKLTGEIFYHYNTHLDHIGKEARLNGAKLILDRIRSKGEPTVLTGDFNFLEKTKVYDFVVENQFNDAKYEADDTMSFGTMNYFTNIHFKLMPPIDFIFLSHDDFEVKSYKVLYQYRYNDKPISDHYAIYSDMIIK